MIVTFKFLFMDPWWHAMIENEIRGPQAMATDLHKVGQI